MKKYIILILVSYIFCYSYALSATANYARADTILQQVHALEKGDQVPDLEFPSLVNAEKQSLKLSDFKGKLVILDFWATWCSPCVAALPKLNELQNKFKDEVQLIGITDQKFDLIESFYKQRLEKQNLDLSFPTATNNSTLRNSFPHQSISHMVWIDVHGTVLAITGSEEVTESNVAKVLAGGVVDFKPKTDRAVRTDVDMSDAFVFEKIKNPIFTHEGVTEGGIRYRSIITNRIDGIRSGISAFLDGRFYASNVLLESLFMSAYTYDNLNTGEFLFPFPINKLRWEVGENDFYNLPTNNSEKEEFWDRESSSFCYDLVFLDYYGKPKEITKSSSKDLRYIALNIMKEDLMKWTGFNSSMERRETKVWVLSLKDSTKIISPIVYTKSEIDPSFIGGTFKNMKMLHFKRSLHQFLQLEAPLIDETNYVGLVNFKLDCKLTDPISLGKELEKFGLELKEEHRKIPLLVVSK